MGPKTKGKGAQKARREAVDPSASAKSTQPKVRRTWVVPSTPRRRANEVQTRTPPYGHVAGGTANACWRHGASTLSVPSLWDFLRAIRCVGGMAAARDVRCRYGGCRITFRCRNGMKRHVLTFDLLAVPPPPVQYMMLLAVHQVCFRIAKGYGL